MCNNQIDIWLYGALFMSFDIFTCGRKGWSWSARDWVVWTRTLFFVVTSSASGPPLPRHSSYIEVQPRFMERYVNIFLIQNFDFFFAGLGTKSKLKSDNVPIFEAGEKTKCEKLGHITYKYRSIKLWTLASNLLTS